MASFLRGEEVPEPPRTSPPTGGEARGPAVDFSEVRGQGVEIDLAEPPTLRALRLRFPDAHISYLMRRYVKPIYAGMAWADRLITYRTGKTKAKAGKGDFFDLAGRLRKRQFDLAVLLPNSFSSAYLVKRAGVAERWGFASDARARLLTRAIPRPRYGSQLSSRNLMAWPKSRQIKHPIPPPITTNDMANFVVYTSGQIRLSSR